MTSDMGYGRMHAVMRASDWAALDKLRYDYATDLAAYKMGDWLSTHQALEAAVMYIEELERWTGKPR